jgi:sortase (surface protein transpeptidase)
MHAPRHRRLSALLAAAGVTLAIAAAVVATGRPAAAPPPPVAPPADPRTTIGPADRGAPALQRHARRPDRRRVALPARVSIPAIGVDARVIRLGLDRNGALEVPSRWGDAGWYVHSPRPGAPGPAVLAGHVDSTSGPAVFYRLGALHRGAAIRVARTDGTIARFRVQRVERWPKAHFPTRRVYGDTRRPTLRLITCGGAFDSGTGHYTDNTIVFAVRS